MAKLAKMPTAGPRSAVRTTREVVLNAQGGKGYAREARSELFLLATSNMVGEDTFYESASDRDERYLRLVREVTMVDPQWVRDMLVWLRTHGNIRSAAIVGAIEYGIAGGIEPRAVLDAVMQRADEPGEALGYWLAKYGRPLPKWLKKALGDGALRLYTEASAFKYDSGPVRFADVIEMSHITRKHDKDGLFLWLLDRRHDRVDFESRGYGFLPVVRAREQISEMGEHAREALLSDPTLMKRAAMTWEALSSFGPMDDKAWSAVIPQMGYMALLRNLRNFDQAGLDREVRKDIAARLSDREQVLRSRQLPFRFFSAYQHVESDFWKPVLNEALEHSISNVPLLSGQTLVMIDNSGSMGGSVSGKSSVTYAMQAALFGMALAKAQPKDTVEVWGFSTQATRFDFNHGSEVLPQAQRFAEHTPGGGTYTATCLSEIFDDRKRRGLLIPRRIVILSDEQIGENAWRDSLSLSQVVPPEVALHTFNLGGYRVAHEESGIKRRHTYSGVTDASFRLMGLVESGQNGVWPWE